ncbi:terpenoid synthase [Epithele typhae]|uniref:terpenoid synthase n=1 Tax=Epithele typhae TaxID=378194 RepID=UPI002008ACA3|nr:terpenoid synthase [Epithele typhae]KAH9940764.1 terpenoid synthase [Epithele typhae]
MSSTITVPDTLASWPYPRRINPHYETVAPESATWVRGFRAFGPRSQRAFDKCNFGLLASLAFPSLSREHLRVGCDVMNLFFVFDEHTDTLPGDSVRVLADISMDAMLHPDKVRPENEPAVGEITRQFWLNARRCSTPTFQRRFVYEWQLYVDSVVEQARDRDHTRFRTVEEHLALRRFTIGSRPSFAIIELGLDIPQDVFDDPLLVDLRDTITDILALDNDMASYNKEQAAGDDLHNVVTLIMHAQHVDLHAALAHAAALHAERARHVLDDLVPAIHALDVPAAVAADLAFYVDGVLNWPRGNDCWTFESMRYFGIDGPRVQRERVVELYPKRRAVAPCV